MKALVTGASGFIGGTLVRHLNERGIEVRTLLRKSSSDAGLKGLKYERVEGDILDPASLERAVEGCDYVLHLAGLVAAKNREDYFRFNAEGTENLARAALARAPNLKRFVLVSSLAAGGPGKGPDPRRESDRDEPVSAYGESKLDAETRLNAYRDRLPVVSVRPPIVYGPRDRGTGLYLILRTLAQGWSVSVGTEGGEEREFSMIHVADLARAIVQAAESPNVKSGDVFYVASDEIVPWSKLVDEISHHLGRKPRRITVPLGILGSIARFLTFVSKATGRGFMLNDDKMNEIRPSRWTCAVDQARDTFGFRPEFYLTNGIKDTIDWYQRNGWK